MTQIQRCATTVAVLAVIVSLAGCAAISSPSTTTPPAMPPTAEPTLEPLGAPQSSVPLGCDQVIPSATVTSAFASPVALQADESSTPLSIELAAAVQGGALTCTWGAESETVYQVHDGLSFTIVAATPAEYAARPVAVDSVLDTLGDGSQLSCWLPAANGYACNASVLAGAYWISASTGDVSDGVTVEAAVATTESLLAEVVQAITSAAPRAIWTPSPDGVDGDALCNDSAAAAAALATDPQELTVDAEIDVPTYPFVLAISRAPFVTCQWWSPTGWASFSTLSGGAWWAERIDSSPPTPTYPVSEAPTPVVVDGVDSAYRYTLEGTVYVVLIVGETATVLGVSNPDPEAALVTAAAVAAASGW